MVTHGAAPTWAAVLTGILALTSVLADVFLAHVALAVHEGGHALAAWMNGRRVTGVWLLPSGGGYTRHTGRPRGFSRTVTAAAGYAAPPLAGLGCAAELARGGVGPMLVLAELALLALLLVIRNHFGELIVVVVGATLILATGYLPAWLETGYAYYLAWLLLFSGPKHVLVLHQARRANGPGSDADTLAGLTHLPAFAFVVGYGLLSLWCLTKGAGLLLG